MRAPEAMAPPREAASIPVREVLLGGWGGGASVPVRLLEPGSPAEFAAALAGMAGPPTGRSGGPVPGVIARGMGRSYGDAAQLREGTVLATARLRGFALDEGTGVLQARAGATLGEILPSAIAAGWSFPVLPGTQHVSIGGAIAGDVHGKNHLTRGSFSRHVLSLELLEASGSIRTVRREEPLFRATAGGMGLTGVILSARIALTPLAGPLMSVDTDRVEGLEAALAALRARGGQHRIAWLDVLGSRTVRGVVTRAEHLPGAAFAPGSIPERMLGQRATVPAWWPAGVLRPQTQRAFNELRFRRAPRRERGRIQDLGANLFPLDALGAWPRLYGPQGLLQYQFAVGADGQVVMERVLEVLRRAGVPVFLATLKALGEPSPAPLSFPIAGWTLALDVPRSAPGLLPALDACDELVAAAGGRVYLSKDARMRPAALKAMYPGLGAWRAARDDVDPMGVWRSDLALRTGLVGS